VHQIGYSTFRILSFLSVFIFFFSNVLYDFYCPIRIENKAFSYILFVGQAKFLLPLSHHILPICAQCNQCTVKRCSSFRMFLSCELNERQGLKHISSHCATIHTPFKLLFDESMNNLQSHYLYSMPILLIRFLISSQ